MAKKYDKRPADFAVKSTAKPKKIRKTRAQRKAEKHALLPIHKRPIVCPPDKAGRHPLFRLGGLICRALVIWLSAAGLTIFISTALQLGVSNTPIFLAALSVVALGMVYAHSGVGRIIASITAVGTLGTIAAFSPQTILDIPYSFLALYNAALTRLHKVGYLTYSRFKIDLVEMTPTSEDTLVLLGIIIVTVLITTLFSACLIKRVRLVPPAIAATSFLVIILTFNIYSRYESNLGIALVIVSFASVLVMAAYDRLYHQKDDKHYDTELKLFEDNDRPVMPDSYTTDKAARAARREAKANLRQKRRNRTVTVDEELSDYFSQDRRAKKQKKAADNAAILAERNEHRTMMRQVRRVKNYDRITAESRTAMGGYAAAAVMLACLIAIALPAALVKGNFNTIDAIDEKIELARNYVTALLRGDDTALDRIDYEADGSNFNPHSTELEHLEFDERQIFYIRTRYNTNFYLRGWIGTDYRDGAWQSVNKDLLNKYQGIFGLNTNPSEDMRYDFYHYMMPELVDDPDPNDNVTYPEYYLSKFDANHNYGFVTTIVNLRRVNSPSSMTYFPTSFAAQYGLLEFGTAHELEEPTFVNYYDGIFTGRKFHKNKLSYATVTYAPVMTNSYWIENQAALQAAYNLQKEALLIRDGADSSRVLLSVTEKDDITLFQYTFKAKRKTEEDVVWNVYHKTDSCHRSYSEAGTVWRVDTPYGTLTVTLDGSRVVDANVTYAPGVNLVEQYNLNMDDKSRAALMETLIRDRDYSIYVFQTYMNTSESTAIKELANTIYEQAHAEAVTDNSVSSAGDTVINIPIDVSLANLRNTSIADAYIQRDRLVRNIIDYIITEMACEYTITPDLSKVDPSVDGVENFLFNTKEGYCVQYASAVTLILRELGIPARYVEGYVANGLKKVEQDFIYGGYVMDDQAHAWVEVYYDGVGWIQYETTPEYYIGFYGTGGAVGTTPDTDETNNPETRPNDPPETAAPIDPDTETEADETDPDETGETENPDDITAEEVTKASLIALGVLAGVALIAAVFYTIVSRARTAEAHRQDVASQILESGFGTNTSHEDCREMAREMGDAVTRLLGYFDLAPEPGEFRDDYAERLTAALTALPAGKKTRPISVDTPVLPNLRIALYGIAAEEFGHGMSIAEMKEVAALYMYLHRDVRKRIPGGKRFRLRYVKRMI